MLLLLPVCNYTFRPNSFISPIRSLYTGLNSFYTVSQKVPTFKLSVDLSLSNLKQLEMWANAQRDGRPAEYRWRPLFNAAKFG